MVCGLLWIHNSFNLSSTSSHCLFFLFWVFCFPSSYPLYFPFHQFYTGIKSFGFLCDTQRILGQKVITKSWMATIALSPLREYCYYLVLSSNIQVTRDKMKGENKPMRLPLETWCSLSVTQCTLSNKGNWNSSCIYYCDRCLKWKLIAALQGFTSNMTTVIKLLLF